MTVAIPARLAATCSLVPGRALWLTQLRRAWLAQVPSIVEELQARWSLTLDQPFDGDEVSCSWVAPVRCQDGTRAILKLGMPHMEGEQEIQALRFWDGDPAVYLLQADESLNALLLERCAPGTPLRQLPEPEQDVIMARLLRRLWRTPPAPHPFRPLAAMVAQWSAETIAEIQRWPDPGLVQAGLRVFAELARPAATDVLLATDLHAGNVLRAQREPWLVIDPKPFVGDPAYDATQHLLNCEDRLRADLDGTIRRFADLLELDYARVRLWLFARAAAESRDVWDDDSLALARRLA